MLRPSGRFLALAVAAVTIVWSAHPLLAQDSISTRSVVRLGGDMNQETLLVLGSRVTRDGRGRFYVAPTGDPGKIAAFSSEGEYLQSIGREGDGPDEFRGIYGLATGPADSLYVFDRQGMAVVSPQYRTTRRVRLPNRVTDAVVLDGGAVLLAMPLWSGDGVGRPVHLLIGDEIAASFGEAREAVRRTRPETFHRLLAADGTERFWTGRINRFVFEHWDLNLGRVGVSRPSPAWFRTWDEGRLSQDWMGDHTLIDLDLDSAGLLWTFTRVPDRAGSQSIEQVLTVTVGTLCANADGKISAVDPSTEAELASIRVGCIAFSLGDGIFGVFGETPSGVVYVDIMEAELALHNE